jgi:hypothetical protein
MASQQQKETASFEHRLQQTIYRNNVSGRTYIHYIDPTFDAVAWQHILEVLGIHFNGRNKKVNKNIPVWLWRKRRCNSSSNQENTCSESHNESIVVMDVTASTAWIHFICSSVI